MDQTRFDAIVRSWGMGSRRQALRLLAGAVSAMAGTTAASRSASAQACSSNDDCGFGEECCGQCYPPTTCDCYCADEAEGILCANDYIYCPDHGMACCPPDTFCCYGTGPRPDSCCPVGTECCGGMCCDPEEDEFCPYPNQELHPKCCPTGATVCLHDFSGVICFPTPPCNPGITSTTATAHAQSVALNRPSVARAAAPGASVAWMSNALAPAPPARKNAAAAAGRAAPAAPSAARPPANAPARRTVRSSATRYAARSASPTRGLSARAAGA